MVISRIDSRSRSIVGSIFYYPDKLRFYLIKYQFLAMGATVSRSDFEWVYTEEPHKTRRKLILGECYVDKRRYRLHFPNPSVNLVSKLPGS